MFKLIKNTGLILAASFLFAMKAGAQAEASELTAYLDRLTTVVEATLQQAAEQRATDVSTFMQLAEKNAGESLESGGTAVDIRAQLLCNGCDASATARLYSIRLKDILFPPTTGPTYPAEVLNGLRNLGASVRSDIRLREDERGRLLAVNEGMTRFVTMLQNVHDKNPEYFDAHSAPSGSLAKADPGKKCDSWWCRWGKCAAAIVGGAATGGLSGAAIGSALPGVGTLAGGIVGGIGGGLTAAVNHCD